MDMITWVFFATTLAVSVQCHPPLRELPFLPMLHLDPNSNRNQPQNYMYPEVHRGILGDFFHNLFGPPQTFGQNNQMLQNPPQTFGQNNQMLQNPPQIFGQNNQKLQNPPQIFGQNNQMLQNPFDQMLSTPAPNKPDVTLPALQDTFPQVSQNQNPNFSDHQEKPHNIINDGPENVPDIIHSNNPQNQEPKDHAPNDLDIEDIEVRPEQHHVNENLSNINENSSSRPIQSNIVKEGPDSLQSDQLKLSKVIPSEGKEHPFSFDEANTAKSEDPNEKASALANGKEKKDPGLSKNSDFLLIPVTDNTDSRIVFPDSELVGTSNVAQDSSHVAVDAVNPVLTTSAASIPVSAPVINADPQLISTGTAPLPVAQPAYQVINTVPQNQGNTIPVTIPATGNQPIYSILNVPNSSGYQVVSNQQPVYIVALNTQPNNGGYNNQLFTLVPINQPNTYVPVNNQPNIMTPSSQPNYVILNNPSNISPNSQNVPLANPGGIQYVIIGNQPNNMVPVNPTHNDASFNNQPQNLVPLNSQPVYVTLGNQPNTYIPVDSHTSNIVSSNPANTVIAQSSDPNNVAPFSNSEYTPVSNPNAIQNTIPVVLQPVNSDSIPILIAMKDKDDSQSDDKKDDLNKKAENDGQETEKAHENSNDINKAGDNDTDLIHFPDETEQASEDHDGEHTKWE